MIDRKIPRDISKYQAKLMFGLTTRQVVLFVPGAALGLGTYFLTKAYIGSSAMLAALVMALPFFLFAAYKPLGLPLEKFIKSALLPMFLSPANRRFKSENTYAAVFKSDTATQKKKQTKKFVSKNPENKAV